MKQKITNDRQIMVDRVYYRKCEEGMTFIPDNSVDCVICDLPYGTTNNPWDEIIPFDVLWEQYNRIVKPDGHIVLFSSEPFSTKLKASNLDNFLFDYIWDKKVGANFKSCHTQPLKTFEVISVFKPAGTKVKARDMFYFPQGLIRVDKKMKNRGGKYLGNENNNVGKTYIQEFTNYPKAILDFSKDINTFHPTQKPVALIEYLIKTFTLPGAVVLDNCMGSFTTAIAALNTDRHFIGFENNLEYYQMGSMRLAGAVLEKMAKPLNGDLLDEFYEKNEDYFNNKDNMNCYKIKKDIEEECEDVVEICIETEDFDFELAVNN